MRKFIIAKKDGHLKHIKSYNLMSSGYVTHETLARDNGFDYWGEVIETGILEDGQILIEECRNKEHIKHRQEVLVSNNLRITKARDIESRYMYQSKEAVYRLPEGD